MSCADLLAADAVNVGNSTIFSRLGKVWSSIWKDVLEQELLECEVGLNINQPVSPMARWFVSFLLNLEAGSPCTGEGRTGKLFDRSFV